MSTLITNGTVNLKVRDPFTISCATRLYSLRRDYNPLSHFRVLLLNASLAISGLRLLSSARFGNIITLNCFFILRNSNLKSHTGLRNLPIAETVQLGYY